MKNLGVIIAVVLGLIGCSLAYFYNSKTMVAQKELEEERFLRIDAEESLHKSKQMINKLESQVNKIEKQYAAQEQLFKQSEAMLNDVKLQLKNALNSKSELELKVQQLKLQGT